MLRIRFYGYVSLAAPHDPAVRLRPSAARADAKAELPAPADEASEFAKLCHRERSTGSADRSIRLYRACSIIRDDVDVFRLLRVQAQVATAAPRVA
jgi:hypothetical protein